MKMSFRHISKNTVLLLALFLCACSLEQIPEEENLQNVDKYSQDSDNCRINEFNEMCHKCVIGNGNNANIVVQTYNSSLNETDLAPSLPISVIKDKDLPEYFYQTEQLNSEYERCLQKSIADGRTDLSGFYITRPRTVARIARHFYQISNHKEGAFWVRRLVNLTGRENGYYYAAMEFINYKETKSIAAELLSESSQLGNSNALVLLEQHVKPDNVFTEYQKKHPSENMNTDEN